MLDRVRDKQPSLFIRHVGRKEKKFCNIYSGKWKGDELVTNYNRIDNNRCSFNLPENVNAAIESVFGLPQNTQHNDIQHYDTQHNDARFYDIQH
jgi:hypothetical protein